MGASAYESSAFSPLIMLLSLSQGRQQVISHLPFDVSYEFTCSELPAFVSLSFGSGTLMCMSMAMVIGSEVSSGISSCMISAPGKGKARYGDVRRGLGVLGQWDFWP